MKYTSNLAAPDLRCWFTLANPMLQRLGHDIPSDPDFDPNCGFLSDDEGAILYSIAKAWPKRWADIGARCGWSTAHIALVGQSVEVEAVDPELKNPVIRSRFLLNIERSGAWLGLSDFYDVTSEQFFSVDHRIAAAHIDGNHDAPEPTNDAMRAINAGAQVLVWHDFQGAPIREAVAGVMLMGWRCRVYWTPNLMAVAWRDGCGFVPPDHLRDPNVDWSGMERIVAEDFDVGRCV